MHFGPVKKSCLLYSMYGAVVTATRTEKIRIDSSFMQHVNRWLVDTEKIRFCVLDIELITLVLYSWAPCENFVIKDFPAWVKRESSRYI